MLWIYSSIKYWGYNLYTKPREKSASVGDIISAQSRQEYWPIRCSGFIQQKYWGYNLCTNWYINRPGLFTSIVQATLLNMSSDLDRSIASSDDEVATRRADSSDSDNRSAKKKTKKTASVDSSDSDNRSAKKTKKVVNKRKRPIVAKEAKRRRVRQESSESSDEDLAPSAVFDFTTKPTTTNAVLVDPKHHNPITFYFERMLDRVSNEGDEEVLLLKDYARRAFKRGPDVVLPEGVESLFKFSQAGQDWLNANKTDYCPDLWDVHKDFLKRFIDRVLVVAFQRKFTDFMFPTAFYPPEVSGLESTVSKKKDLHYTNAMIMMFGTLQIRKVAGKNSTFLSGKWSSQQPILPRISKMFVSELPFKYVSVYTQQLLKDRAEGRYEGIMIALLVYHHKRDRDGKEYIDITLYPQAVELEKIVS